MSKPKKNPKTYKNIDEIAKDIFKKALYLYGKDIFIVNDIIDDIINKNFNASVRELNVKTIDGKKAKAEDIADEMNALPVFDKYKLLIVKNSILFEKSNKPDALKEKDDKSNTSKEKGAKTETSKVNELIKLLKEKPDYLLIVFISLEMPFYYNVLSNYFKENDAAYELDGCDIKDEFIKKWIISKASEIDFNLDMQSANFFLSHIGYYDKDVNAEILYNELNKLSCYCADKKTADNDDIKKVCTSYIPESIDILINAVNNKNLSQACIAFEHLTNNNTYPTVILSSIVTNFNIMLLYKQYSKSAKLNAWDMLAKIKKMNSIKYARYENVDNILKSSSNFSERKIKSIIYTCAKYDNGVKSGIIDARTGFERILYFICT